MAKTVRNVFKKKVTENFEFKDSEFEAIGMQLKEKVNKVFAEA
jgi:hypothetical protein